MSGLTSVGFDPKTTAEILADMESAELSALSPNLDLQPTSLIGVLNGIMSAATSEVWELGEALYTGMDPDTATGDQLVGLALLSGTVRRAATSTQVVGCTVNVDGGFSADAGTMIASIVGNDAAQFTNKTAVANAGGTPANETVDFEAIDTGAQQCLAGTLTVIAEALSGWNSITNPDDGVIGKAIATDIELRTTRDDELTASGSATAAAIRADILAQMQPPTTTSATTGVTVLYNDTDTTDANGLTPHSIEVIALQTGATSGDDQLLANLILISKSAGIGTHGTSSKSAVDSQGNTQQIYYTRPSTTTLTVTITVLTDSTFTGSAATIKSALTDYAGTQYQPGVEVYPLALVTQALKLPGVVDITTYTVNSGTANIPIDVRHMATLSSGGISVVIT